MISNDGFDSVTLRLYPMVTLRLKQPIPKRVVDWRRPPSLSHIPEWVKTKYPGIRKDTFKYGYKGVGIQGKGYLGRARSRIKYYAKNMYIHPFGQKRGSYIGTFKTIEEAACIAHLAMVEKLKTISEVREFIRLYELKDELKDVEEEKRLHKAELAIKDAEIEHLRAQLRARDTEVPY